ncbi:hypothetical protein LguiB_029166 [Lonicera macranthoides]
MHQSSSNIFGYFLKTFLKITTDNPSTKGSYNLLTFLQWFKTPQQWMDALKFHYHRYCLIQFNKPLKTPHPDGDNAQIVKWFPRNLAKSIKEPENVAYVTFLQEICSLNKVDYESVPDSIKFGTDPWLTKNMQDVDCLPLFKCLYTYVQKHHWEEGEQSSDTIAFAGLSSDSDENREPDPEEVQQQLDQQQADWVAVANEVEEWEQNNLIIPIHDSPPPEENFEYDADTDEDYMNSPWQNWQNPDDNHWNHSPDAPDTPYYGSGNETN